MHNFRDLSYYRSHIAKRRSTQPGDGRFREGSKREGKNNHKTYRKT